MPASGARASFSISIPKKVGSAHARSPKTVPSGTQSIRFTLVKTDSTAPTPISTLYPAQVYPLTGTSPGCVDNADQPLLAIDLLSLLPNISLPGSTQILPTSTRIFVVALDAQGNQIIAPDTFDTPVTLTLRGPQLVSTGNRRRPQIGAPTPPPSPAPQTLVSLSVQYAFPQSGVTSASTDAQNASIPVLSPADKTVITPLGGPIEGDVQVTAGVNGTVQASALFFVSLISVCPAGDVGTAPFNCAPPSPTPFPLSWQNPLNNLNFTPAQSGNNAAVDAVLSSTSSFTAYTLQFNTAAVSRTLTVDATACFPAIAEAAPANQPSPTPSPVSTTIPVPSPTPNAAAYVIQLTGADPSVTFYWGQTAPAVHCTVKGTDNASHEADLDFNFTQGQITIQGGKNR